MANSIDPLERGHLQCVLAVPTPPLVAPMPIGRLGSNPLQVGQLLGRPMVVGVPLAMLGGGEADEVVGLVVEWILVVVVDVASVRDGAVVVFPDFSVQRLDAPGTIRLARREIPLMIDVGRVRIAAESDPAIHDAFDSSHETNSSPTCKESAGTNPLPFLYIG